ncbi:hypothetical protein I7I50_01314 [Histoplasma capsulatum G186AR]|uniref:Uncharacterized protein n=1 Tax=Ajellomyces capsulatus TaxID=5037 RepID=A0A8H7Z066_AJECA|nr:hypothetical protein I7I52_08859 [Histoplasma capsulatum]QSS73224.1 hypothetical protein I7I50_01314 [Histoplasma capsulatum G186AR]
MTMGYQLEIGIWIGISYLCVLIRFEFIPSFSHNPCCVQPVLHSLYNFIPATLQPRCLLHLAAV